MERKRPRPLFQNIRGVEAFNILLLEEGYTFEPYFWQASLLEEAVDFQITKKNELQQKRAGVKQGSERLRHDLGNAYEMRNAYGVSINQYSCNRNL